MAKPTSGKESGPIYLSLGTIEQKEFMRIASGDLVCVGSGTSCEPSCSSNDYRFFFSETKIFPSAFCPSSSQPDATPCCDEIVLYGWTLLACAILLLLAHLFVFRPCLQCVGR